MKLRYILTILLLTAAVYGIKAQATLETFVDIGSNNVSEGVFIKNVYRGNYNYQKYAVETGLQLDYLSNNPNTLTGFDVIGSRSFLINDFFFNVKSFFVLNRFSDIAHETNWGFAAETKKMPHFIFTLGTNFRTYTINSDAQTAYDIRKSDSKLKENWNLMYRISAYLKPHNYKWNIGLSCTNMDYYVINQSTNPVFNVQGMYNPNNKVSLFVEAWYKQAGMMNISANYFAYFFRGGIKWKIGETK